jgi:hypothetical protein
MPKTDPDHSIAKRNELPKVQDEINTLRRAEALLQQSVPSREEATKEQRARTRRIDHWMRSSIRHRRHWWQLWKR